MSVAVGVVGREQRTQDDALQAYLDHMTELLTDKEQPLRETPPGDSRRTVARARTLTVLPRLDGNRQGRVVQFLYESDLITKNSSVVNLNGADLRGAALNFANLTGADLSLTRLAKGSLIGAEFAEADLSGAKLSGADLEEARLLRAELSGADLGGANLNLAAVTERQLAKSAFLGEATMPDGLKQQGIAFFKDRPAKKGPPTSGEMGLTDSEYEHWLKDYKDWHAEFQFHALR